MNAVARHGHGKHAGQRQRTLRQATVFLVAGLASFGVLAGAGVSGALGSGQASAGATSSAGVTSSATSGESASSESASGESASGVSGFSGVRLAAMVWSAGEKLGTLRPGSALGSTSGSTLGQPSGTASGSGGAPGQLTLTPAERLACPAVAAACVDLAAHLTWLQSNGKVTFGPLPMEPGLPGTANATPRGTFHVEWKAGPGFVSNEYGDPMPWATFFAPGGVAFHGGSLTKWSHGCVHLTVANAHYYHDHLAIGAEVVVF